MPLTKDEPTIPTDRDALLAREASRALDEGGTGPSALKVQVVEAGKDCKTLELPFAAAALLRIMLKESSRARRYRCADRCRNHDGASGRASACVAAVHRRPDR